MHRAVAERLDQSRRSRARAATRRTTGVRASRSSTGRCRGGRSGRRGGRPRRGPAAQLGVPPVHRGRRTGDQQHRRAVGIAEGLDAELDRTDAHEKLAIRPPCHRVRMVSRRRWRASSTTGASRTRARRCAGPDGFETALARLLNHRTHRRRAPQPPDHAPRGRRWSRRAATPVSKPRHPTATTRTAGCAGRRRRRRPRRPRSCRSAVSAPWSARGRPGRCGVRTGLRML